MTPFILYLVKVNGVLLLFAIAYYLVLRNLTFYKINRFFLLGGLLFSSVYPFIDLTTLFYSQKSIDTTWIQYVPATSLQEMAAPGFAWQMVTWIFYAGIIVMSVRFVLQLLSLRNIHSRSVQSPELGRKVRELKEKIYPFTFWQTIYLNPAMHEEADLKMIMEHEKVHVKQWHTLDILLSQLSGIFYWFNPGIWFMKIFIKENLEFLTDQAVIQKGIEKKVYQYNVLKVEAGISSVTLANSFNLSGIKRRIRMMNTTQSSKSRLAIYFILLPVLILFTLAFTISKVQEVPEKKMTQHPDATKMIVATPAINVEDPVVEQIKTLSSPGKKQARNRTETNIPKSQKGIATLSQTPVKESPETLSDIEQTTLMENDRVSTNDKVITVIGRALNINDQQNVDPKHSNPENKKKEIILKFVQGFKIPLQDGTITREITYYKNGVKIPSVEVPGIETDDIREISVIKNKEGGSEIYLNMKEKKEPKQ